MKKFIAFFTVLALLAVPVSAMAVKAGDWELVGYTKLETYWDSVQVNKNLSGPLLRSNALQPQNMGRLRFTAQSSRFGLKVNGPEVLGAKTQGYIEIDFDSNQDGRQSASNSYIPRMRHAWFRMDWPGGEGLSGSAARSTRHRPQQPDRFSVPGALSIAAGTGRLFEIVPRRQYRARRRMDPP